MEGYVLHGRSLLLGHVGHVLPHRMCYAFMDDFEQEHRHKLQDQTDAFPVHVHIFLCM